MGLDPYLSQLQEYFNFRSTTTTTGTGAPRRPGTKPGGNEKGEGKGVVNVCLNG